MSGPADVPDWDAMAHASKRTALVALVEGVMLSQGATRVAPTPPRERTRPHEREGE